VTSPLGGGKGTDADKLPSTVSVVDSQQIARTGSLNISDALQQNVPAINISEVSGNPFSAERPVSRLRLLAGGRHAAGLAVYQNGVRINEGVSATPSIGI